MDRKEMLKKALGRIKKMSLGATASRFKSRGEKKAPETKAPDLEEPETDEDELAELEPDVEEPADDVDEPEDVSKKTVLITMTRPGKVKGPSAPKPPTKRKPGRPRKA